MAQALSIRKTDSIFEKLRDMQDRIMHRAYEIFDGNGGAFGWELDHWLQAERELVWTPRVELREKDGEFRIEISVPGVEAEDLDIEVTPEDILVKAEMAHEHEEERGKVHFCEFETGNMFRAIHLPKKVNVDKVKAEFKNGILKVTAEIAEEARAKKIKVGAA
jgi:HSP20 family protein